MMETEEKETARIASDVRKATRERVEAELSEIKVLNHELVNEQRRCKRVCKEKIADYYYKISILFLTSSAIGYITLFIKGENTPINWYVLIFGLIATLFFALLANYILKH